MAYFLRKVAIIGLIAWNSPVHSGRPAETAMPQSIRQAVETVETGARNVTGSLTAAREAAQILAGLDPEIRDRILNGAMSAATGKSAIH